MSQATKAAVWKGVLLRVGGSGAVLALMFWFLPVDKLWGTMKQVSPTEWTLVLIAYLGAHFIGVSKWRVMVNLAGAELSWTQAARCYFAGLLGNVFLPSLVGGDVIRAALGVKMGRSGAGVLLGSFFDRLIDIGAIGLMATSGVLLLPGALNERSRKIFLGVAALLAAGGAIALGVLWLLGRRGVSFKIRRKLVKLRRAGRQMRQRPQFVLLALSFGILMQLTFITMMTVLSRACGLDIAWRMWLFAYPLAKLSALAPATLGGIGVREAALGALLVPFKQPFATTVAVGLMWETVVIAGGFVGGVVAMFVGRPANERNPRISQIARKDLEPQMDANKH